MPPKKKIINKGGQNNKNKEGIELYTSNTVNGKQSIGLVRGMAMTKVSSFKTFLSGISSIMGDTDEKFSGIHNSILETQNKAIRELLKNAKKIGAKKVIGIRIDNSEISSGERTGIFIVYAYGTAIK